MTKESAKILEHKINIFDKGFTNDFRDDAVTNFDVSNAKKLSPYHDSENGDTNDSTDKLQNFLLALGAGTQYVLYGLGVVSGQDYAKLFTKNTFSDGTWTAATNGADDAIGGDLALNPNFFIYYKKAGLIFGARGSRYLFSYDPAAQVFSKTARDLTSFNNIAQGLVHSKDDVLYIPYDNNIATNNNGGWNNTALVLPKDYVITSICEYGNLLAIGCVNLNGASSRVFLWDRDSTLTTLNESVDWGSGQLKVLEEIDGQLIGISLDSYAIDGFGGTGTVTRLNDVVTFRYLSGATAITFKKLTGTTNTQLPIAKQKINSKLYFLMSIVTGANINLTNGTRREGVWSIGRIQEGAPFILVHERTPNNDTALGASGQLQRFFYVGDYLFITSTTTSSTATYQTVKTNDASSWTASSLFETEEIDMGDISLNKKLLSVTVDTETLIKGAQVVVSYKKNEEIAWTTIFTNTTVTAGSFVVGTKYTIVFLGTTDFTLIGASSNTVGVEFIATGVGTGTGAGAHHPIRHTARNIESSGAQLPQFKKIQFQIKSTGGCEIIGISCKAEVIDDDVA